MPTRPKQRVLVRWNDDLDKALLLFITHICAESGIKIPYDEVARRMGSTFTEGAITQHLSKLRTKMAELNVVPVPDAPKRGSVTNKPSSVYAQKVRGGPALPQPAASKTQAKNAVSRTTMNNTNKKRSTKRKKDFIKRSESDDAQTDDEFDGGSDDDFVADRSLRNKRKRDANDSPDQARRQTTTSEDQQARTTRYVNESIENMAGRGFYPHFGQTSQSAGYEEEEEDDDTGRGRGYSQLDPSTTNAPNPFALHQEKTVSPNALTRMPARINSFATHDDSQAFRNNISSDIRMMPQPFALSTINHPGYQTSDASHAYFPQPSQPSRTYVEHGNPMSSLTPPTATAMNASPLIRSDTDGSYNTQARSLQNAVPVSQIPGSNQDSQQAFIPELHRVEMNPAQLPLPAVMPNYGGAHPITRNGSMTSSNSQMTYTSPMTPMLRRPGIFSTQQSPFDFNANNLSPATFDLPTLDEPALPTQMRNTEWGYDGQNEMFDSHIDASGENVVTNRDRFANELFY